MDAKENHFCYEVCGTYEDQSWEANTKQGDMYVELSWLLSQTCQSHSRERGFVTGQT